MFFIQKPLVLYLSASGLTVFQLDSNKQQSFPFPLDAVQHAEIVDQNKLREALNGFLKGLGLKNGKGVIILAKELVYSFEFDNTKDETSETERFVAALPLTKETITTLVIRNKTKTGVFVTNRKLFEAVGDAVEQLGITIHAVTPRPAFTSQYSTQDPTSQDVKNMLKERRILQKFNFLLDKQKTAQVQPTLQVDESDQVPQTKSSKKQYVMLFFSLMLLASAGGYLLLWSKIITIPGMQTTPSSNTTSAKPTPVITLKPTPTIIAIDKSTVSIEVLNGSGIAGQAGKLQQLLSKNGYANVTTGNASATQSTTTIAYDKSFSQKDLTSLLTIIKGDFPNATLQQSIQTAKYDIIVTTGSASQ